MKESELRKVSTCSACKKGVMHTGLPLFWLLKVSRHGIKMNVVQRQTGLEMMMGGHVGLAQVFSPDEDMTQVMDEEKTLTFCENCMAEFNLQILSIVEAMNDKAAS